MQNLQTISFTLKRASHRARDINADDNHLFHLVSLSIRIRGFHIRRSGLGRGGRRRGQRRRSVGRRRRRSWSCEHSRESTQIGFTMSRRERGECADGFPLREVTICILAHQHGGHLLARDEVLIDPLDQLLDIHIRVHAKKTKRKVEESGVKSQEKKRRRSKMTQECKKQKQKANIKQLTTEAFWRGTSSIR
jgi:hypothetical protein